LYIQSKENNMIYAVTGSTGAFGSLVIQRLLDFKVPASSIVALVHNQSKTAHLVNLGLETRLADYDQPSTLDRALQGVDRLLLVSGSEVGKRLRQHTNVISAAKKAGVKLLVYTSLSHADTSVSPLAPEHKGTEEFLKTSGVPFVILRNNWYTENYSTDLKQARTTGIIEAAVGTGKVASASRSDYAEAAARVLIGEGHAGRTYELAGEAWDYNALAKAASEVLGRPVVYKTVNAAQRTQSLMAAGLSQDAAGFVVALEQSIEAGSLAQAGEDLEKLLGRKPKSLTDGLKASLELT
jgi:NAD(P)H dehydrogenase (quinone)